MQPGVVPAPSKEGDFSDQDRTYRFKAIKVFRITAIMQPGAGPPSKKGDFGDQDRRYRFQAV